MGKASGNARSGGNAWREQIPCIVARPDRAGKAPGRPVSLPDRPHKILHEDPHPHRRHDAARTGRRSRLPAGEWTMPTTAGRDLGQRSGRGGGRCTRHASLPRGPVVGGGQPGGTLRLAGRRARRVLQAPGGDCPGVGPEPGGGRRGRDDEPRGLQSARARQGPRAGE